MFYRACRILFTLLVAYPVTLVWLGLAVRHKEKLPRKGPAIIIANHNSHLDFLTLLSLFPLAQTPSLFTAAAADYFFGNAPLRFIARWFLGLVPVERGVAPQAPCPAEAPGQPGKSRHALLQESMQGLSAVLQAGNILLLFPEGTRSVTPESMSTCKAGVWYLLKENPQTVLCPVYLHGLGRSLPKGQRVPIPFFIDICVGDPINFVENKREFMQTVHASFAHLRSQTIASLTHKE